MAHSSGSGTPTSPHLNVACISLALLSVRPSTSPPSPRHYPRNKGPYLRGSRTFLTCRLPGSCNCFALCHGHNTSSGFCLCTKRRTSPPHMTGQSLLALSHFSVLSPPERSWQTASHAGARSSPCNMVALRSIPCNMGRCFAGHRCA